MQVLMFVLELRRKQLNRKGFRACLGGATLSGFALIRELLKNGEKRGERPRNAPLPQGNCGDGGAGQICSTFNL
jgi:hypothetical protein